VRRDLAELARLCDEIRAEQGMPDHVLVALVRDMLRADATRMRTCAWCGAGFVVEQNHRGQRTCSNRCAKLLERSGLCARCHGRFTDRPRAGLVTWRFGGWWHLRDADGLALCEQRPA
jgi:hypothetical protein